MTTKELEEELVSKLSTVFPDLLVESYPDVIGEDYDLLHEKGAILICWNGVTEIKRDLALQSFSDEFEIAVLSRSRSGPDGVLGIIDNIRKSVNEAHLYGMRLFFVSANRTAYYITQGIWHYTVRVLMPSFEYN